MKDISQQLHERVSAAVEKRESLNIVSGNTKKFLGHVNEKELLDVSEHTGIVSYDPTELVVTARGGTLLSTLETTLSEQHQMLPFEPPHFGTKATLAGTIACNLSGPRRPYVGAARDFVLGMHIINGNAEILHFGGEVIKNVAGYDVSRLMTGAMGTLGIILDISIKVLPQPATAITLALEQTTHDAIEVMNQWAKKPFPISATCFDGDQVFIRLEGARTAVEAARKKLGGEQVKNNDEFWNTIREHKHGFFHDEKPLWRLSVPPATPLIELTGKWLYDWGGAQRWYKGDAHADTIRRTTLQHGGHATLFRSTSDTIDVFQPLTKELLVLHQNLKTAFDPHGIFNIGRMYKEI